MPVFAFPTFKRIMWIAITVMGLALAGLIVSLHHFNIAPRSLGPYLERRTEGHHPLIVKIGKWARQTLVDLDRGEELPFALPPVALGAQPVASSQDNAVGTKAAQTVLVNSVAAARAAIENARPGDVITFLPGTYYVDTRAIHANQAGTAAAPITVRAQELGKVTLLFDITEGFKVSKPYWVFENLIIQGVCKSHANCEHAFHVVGDATHFIARNNSISDFNAHFKVNGEGSRYPDHGTIESNTLTNAGVRMTSNPVTPIDIVGASDWGIRRNVISDFIKGEGNRVSYGAFAKGAGSGNRFERNIVLCEHRLRGFSGQRVGLSFGGGGTGTAFCRDRHCVTEHDGGVIENNLIAFCSDDGIYLNRAATARVTHNTLLDTAGVTVRFAVSSADLEGNLVDGILRSRDDGVVRATDNVTRSMLRSYLGWHPVRDLFRQASVLDLVWRGSPPQRNAEAVQGVGVDLCESQRAAQPVYGAFENFAKCLTTSSTQSASSLTSVKY